VNPAPAWLHIPDGFLSLPVAAAGWLVAVVVIAVGMRHTRQQMGERQIPLMGVLAAFIFAAQAVNFPVAAGTSGHLIGGALAAIAVGPWAGALIMTAVVIVQALLFQDGGLLAMGWNIVNMGALSAFAGFAGYLLVRRILGENPAARVAAAFVAGWISVETGAIAAAAELAVSGTTPLVLGLPAMASVHAVIGLGEGMITAGAVTLLQLRRPGMIQASEAAPGRGGSLALVGLGLLTLVAVLLSPLASVSPDGLESVAEQQGFLSQARPSTGAFSDYTLPNLANPVWATMAAIALGTLVVFAAALAVGWVVRRKANPPG
jgi:cobalt/nickel transport system permease protein